MAAPTAVLGIYRSRADVERGIDALRDAGFSNNDISALFAQGDATREFSHEQGTKAPEGATTGGTTGMVLGGTLGWLAGIGALAIPGLGPFIAAGPIMAALAGAGVGGAVGGLTGALIGLGFPEYEAKRYEGRVKEGGILLSVHCRDASQTGRAREILQRTGADDISASAQTSGEPAAGTAREAGRRTSAYAEPASAAGAYEPVGAGAGDWSRHRDECRRDFETHQGTSGATWSTMEPAYQYGHRMAADPRYRGRSWAEVEGEIRASYAREQPHSQWDSVKDAVRYGWERVSGRR
jgi:hypothetical protein